MNLEIINNKFVKILLIISAIFFLWVSSFGLIYHMNQMGMDGSKNGCIFSSPSDSCVMNFSEHITFWQGLTISLSQDMVGVMSIILMLAIIATALIFYSKELLLSSLRIFSRFKLYIKQHPQINLFNYLKEVFSSGILNKKIYELATI